MPPTPVTEIEERIDALRGQDAGDRHPRVSLDHTPCAAFVAPLLAATTDPDPYIRASAVHALASYEPEEHAQLQEALFKSLADDPDPSVRSAAAEVMARMPGDTVAALLAALGDASADVRMEAVLALSAFEASDVVAAVTDRLHRDSAPEVRERAVMALERLKPEGVAGDLVRALEDPSALVRSAAACALGEHDAGETPVVLDALLLALSDPSAGVRENAARALRYSAAEAIPGLMALLADEASEARREATGALGTLGANQAIGALAERLRNDTDAEVRRGAAAALGDLGTEAATAHLIDAFGQEAESAEVRTEIVRALGSAHDVEALPVLCAALGDADAETREAAAEALQWLLDPEVPASMAALEPLCLALKDAVGSVRAVACGALGALNDARALPFLMQAGRDGTEECRIAALEAIARIDATAGEALLLEALADAATDVRRVAAKSLVLSAHAPIPSEVLDCMADPEGDPFARCDLAKSLAQRGGLEAVPVLLDLLRDGSGHVRAAAAQALCELPDPRAMRPLTALLDDDDEDVRGEAALALAALADDRAIEPLQALLNDDCPPVRRRVVWALSFFTPSKVLPLLVDALQDDDPDVQSTAASALADVCDAPALRRILSALPAGCDDVGSALEEAAAASEEDEGALPRSAASRRVQLGTVHYE
ncbi:HEAT repeat domain-containing protein [Variovorax paradoxus]|uniref:HEAT repeat domain-containing protein n=1 Tax=Variovorax paradoxus TaxID=34073 RepID=A0A679JFQ5_VARPD|nr:hypothetical protein VVAX_06650 [Variovorax paradoxus]